jgi:UDP-N-acetylglucosamine 1-carboxyvinyltransferase
MSTMLTRAEGMSIVTETIWDERFKHLEELTKMGAKARIEGRNAIIEGVAELQSAEVTGTDLRASASLIMAGLVADGETTVHGVDHMDRGYERLDQKLCALGAQINRT